MKWSDLKQGDVLFVISQTTNTVYADHGLFLVIHHAKPGFSDRNTMFELFNLFTGFASQHTLPKAMKMGGYGVWRGPREIL